MEHLDSLMALVLRHAVAEQRARLAEIEGSPAWRAGGVLDDLLRSPLRRGLGALVVLFRLFVRVRRRHVVRSAPGPDAVSRPIQSLEADCLVYGGGRPEGDLESSHQFFDDMGECLRCIENRAEVGTLVLRRVDLASIRPLARLQMQGWQLVWWPESASPGPQHLVDHVAALADEVRGSYSQ